MGKLLVAGKNNRQFNDIDLEVQAGLLTLAGKAAGLSEDSYDLQGRLAAQIKGLMV
jgi:hypothetical protein